MVWERELDIYGKVKTETQESANFVPFRYQEQYYDSEVDLCYNRFRYYDCNTGTYISQDPIGLIGENPTMYGYVFDSNTQIDPLGLHIASAVYTNSQGVVGEVGKFDSLGGVHSEPKILSQMGNQKGGHLEIISLGPKGDGSKSFFRNPNGSVYPAGPLPPCSFRSKNCDALLHSYAKSNNMYNRRNQM